MSDLASRNSAFMIVLLVLGFGFCQPVHVFPLVNFLEELVIALGVLLATAALLWRVTELRLSIWAGMWLALGAIGAFSAWIHPAPFIAYKLLMAVFWLVALLALIIGDQINWCNHAERSADKLALALLIIGLICCVGGFLRFYGLLGDVWRAYVPEPNTGRMTGLVGHSNFFAFISLFSLVAAGWMFDRGRMKIWLAALIIVLLSAGMVASGSRGVLLAWIAVVFILAMRFKETASQKWLFFMVAAFGFYWLVRPLYFAFDQWFYSLVLQKGWVGGAGTEHSDVMLRGAMSEPRLLEWRATFALIQENFLTGVGVGNYAVSSYEQHLSQGTPSPDGSLFLHSHSSPLQILVELGVAGLVWLLSLFFLAVKCFWKASKEKNRLLPLLVVLVMQVYSFIEFPLWIMHFLVLHMLLLGALGGPAKKINLNLGKPLALVLLLLLLTASVIYLPIAEKMYWSYRQYFLRAPVQQGDYSFLDSMIRDPFLEPFGYVIYFANFNISSASVAQEREVLERFRQYLPFPQIMVRLAIVQLIEGDEAQAVKTLSELERYYGKTYRAVLYEQVDSTKPRFPDVRFERLFIEAN